MPRFFITLETVHNETGDPRYRPHPLLRKMVRAGWLGIKTGKGFFLYDRNRKEILLESEKEAAGKKEYFPFI